MVSFIIHWGFTKLIASTSDPDNDCRDSQMAPVEPNKYIEQPASGFIFHLFPQLPWELRRLVWEFALPRNVFLSASLTSETCVHYPTISQVCREASLVMKEFGSMVTAWDGHKTLPSFVTDDIHVYRKTWFSLKLDTIMLNPGDLRIRG